MNIVVITIDTLRYDFVGFHGAGRDVEAGSGSGPLPLPVVRTPNLDRLASESIIWDSAYSCSYPTYPHRTDVITGKYGAPFNPWMPLRQDITVLPQVLSGQYGYCTQLIHDTPVLVNGGAGFDWPFHAWTQVRGASTDRPWIDDKSFEWIPSWSRDPFLDDLLGKDENRVIGHTITTYLRANRSRKVNNDWNVSRLFRTAAEFARDNSRRDNFFLWIDCFDPHEPWDAPVEFIRNYDDTVGEGVDPRLFDYVWLQQSKHAEVDLPENQLKRLRACYAGKVEFMDHCLGYFLDALDSTGLAKNTSVVLTADHGTCLGDGGKFSKRIFTEIGEPECHIPMMIRVPGESAYRTNAVVQPHDIYPTVLYLATGQPDAARQTRAGEGGGEIDGIAMLGDSRSDREIALASAAPCHGWKDEGSTTFFTAFTDRWVLNVAADTTHCRLYAHGSGEDVAADNPDVVRQLKTRAVEELRSRDSDGRFADWFASGGETGFPAERTEWPGAPGWIAYWGRLYDHW